MKISIIPVLSGFKYIYFLLYFYIYIYLLSVSGHAYNLVDRNPVIFYVLGQLLIVVILFPWLNFLLCLQTCPRLILVPCVIVSDDLWRENINKTICVGGCRCGLWFYVLVKKKRKKKCFCPHTGPVWMLSLFQGLRFANTAEMQHAGDTHECHFD